MAMKVPIYQRQVTEAGGSTYRAPSFAGDVQRNVRALGQGIGAIAQAGADIVQRSMDANDFAAFQKAKLDAANARLDALAVANSTHGLELMAKADEMNKRYEKALDGIGEKLNARLREKWQTLRDNESMSFKSGLARRVGDEGERLQAEVYETSVKTKVREAAAIAELPPDEATAEETKAVVDDMRKDALERARHLAVTDAMRDDMVEEALTPVHTAFIEGALARNQWREAEEHLNKYGSDMDADTRRRAKKLIKLKRIEVEVEEKSSEVLGANNFKLAPSLEAVDKLDIPPEVKKEVREEVTRRYRLHDLAMREKDAPIMGELSEAIWSQGKSPYSNPKQQALMMKLEPERRAIVAKEWKSYLRSRKAANSAAKAEHNREMRARLRLFEADLADDWESVPDPEDPTSPYYEGIDRDTRAQMIRIYKVKGKIPAEDRRDIDDRLYEYAMKKGKTPAETKEFKARVWRGIRQKLVNGRLPEGTVYDVIEPIILEDHASKQSDIYNFFFRSDEEIEEKAMEDAAEDLDIFEDMAGFDYSGGVADVLPADLTPDQLDQLRVEAKRRYNLDKVTEADIVRLFQEMERAGAVQ